ncbi:MAG: ABC transporter permease [Bryobacteraceae bacterium]
MRRGRLEQDLEDELAFHLAMKVEASRAAGAPERQASHAAHRHFGNPAVIRERLRDAWTFPFLESVWQDARHAVRALGKSRVFTVVAVLSLAIGIGANTSIFTVFNALFLRTLPVRDPQQLRIVNWTGTGRDLVPSHSGYGSGGSGGVRTGSGFSFEAFQEIQNQSQVFSSVAGFAHFSANVLVRSQAHIAPAQLVSGGYFHTLGTQAALGRTLLQFDDSLAAPPAAVISWRLYQRLYGADSSALGSEIVVDKTPYTIVGVLPPNVYGISPTSPVDLYVPLARAEELSIYKLNDPGSWWVQVIGRITPGTSDAQLRAALDVSLSHIALKQGSRAGKKIDAPRSVIIDGRTGLAFLKQAVRDFLLILLAMVGLVLLIACTNVANLLMARGSARSRELAIRRSLGAGRVRIIRYLMTESLLLALLAGAFGLIFAQAGTVLLTQMLFPTDPESTAPIRLDAAVLAFTGGLSLATAILFGLLPAVRAARAEPASCMKQAGAGTGPVRQRLARALVVIQVSTALVLVVGAGLFARTLLNLGRVELGFRPDHLLLFYVEPQRNGYKDQRLIDVYRRIQEKVSAIPGVQAVTLVRSPLLSGWSSSDWVTIPGYEKKAILSYVHIVGERFLTIMGTPILLGRDFRLSDDQNSAKVAIVNAAMGKKYFDGNPVGREFSFGSSFDKPIRIVGVAADVKYDNIRREVPPTVYLPWPQRLASASGMTFQLRTSVDPLSISDTVRRAVAEVDPTLPVAELRTQEQVIQRATSREHTVAVLAGFFSGVAVILACIGIYGVLAYTVTRRTSEFGIRLALGATGGQIRWLVLKGTLALIACSILIGIPCALAATRVLRRSLYGVEPDDSLTLAVAGAAILISALLAAWIPSQRAAKSDPAAALRYE